MSVIIVGGGMAGATLALAISRLSHGALPVHLIEATAPESHAHPGFELLRWRRVPVSNWRASASGNLWLIAQLPSPPCMSAIVVTLDLSPSPQKITNWRRWGRLSNCTMSGNGCLHCCVKHLA